MHDQDPVPGQNKHYRRVYNSLNKDRYKMIVFNSPCDFYDHSPGDIGAKAVYDIINYDRIDCLIIDKMHNSRLYRSIR